LDEIKRFLYKGIDFKVMRKSTLVFAGILVLMLGLGVIQIIKDYNAANVTGEVVSGKFNIEEYNLAEAPVVAALLSTRENKLFSNELENVREKDGRYVAIKPTLIPARKDDHYLWLEWDERLMVLSIYMKKEDPSKKGSFEIWSANNRKVASGELTNEFRWYNFDVSTKEMSAEGYALFDHGEGESNIIVDQVLGVPYPESGLTKLTGMVIGKEL
jgi:hypothetical protein